MEGRDDEREMRMERDREMRMEREMDRGRNGASPSSTRADRLEERYGRSNFPSSSSTGAATAPPPHGIFVEKARKDTDSSRSKFQDGYRSHQWYDENRNGGADRRDYYANDYNPNDPSRGGYRNQWRRESYGIFKEGESKGERLVEYVPERRRQTYRTDHLEEYIPERRQQYRTDHLEEYRPRGSWGDRRDSWGGGRREYW